MRLSVASPRWNGDAFVRERVSYERLMGIPFQPELGGRRGAGAENVVLTRCARGEARSRFARGCGDRVFYPRPVGHSSGEGMDMLALIAKGFAAAGAGVVAYGLTLEPRPTAAVSSVLTCSLTLWATPATATALPHSLVSTLPWRGRRVAGPLRAPPDRPPPRADVEWFLERTRAARAKDHPGGGGQSSPEGRI